MLLINDENGYHIIMKIILEIPENQRNNLNLFLITHLEQIIINRYGAYCATKFIINNYYFGALPITNTTTFTALAVGHDSSKTTGDYVRGYDESTMQFADNRRRIYIAFGN